jgi:dienelactone hydrolase
MSIPHELQPAHTLWPLYNPASAPHAFRALTQTDAIAWQSTTRAALAKTLKLDLFTRQHADVTLIRSVDKGDFVRHKYLLRTGAHTVMPFYLLIPKNVTTPLPTVVAFAGHGYGVADIVGLWEDGSERTRANGYHADFAVALCRAGFAVAAPEISCFGERQTDFGYLDDVNGQPIPGSTCTHTAMLAFHLGLSVPSMRVHDALCLVDYLATRADLDIQRLGAMGISGGGMHTLFSMCIDERFKAGIISGYFSTFRDSILAMHHCACNFVPGLATFGEMHDLAGLIAPRPLFIEAGTRDPIFPIGAVQRGVSNARAVYRIFEASQRITLNVFEGRHEVHGGPAYPWLKAQLAY